jgi:hypothetical protein
MADNSAVRAFVTRRFYHAAADRRATVRAAAAYRAVAEYGNMLLPRLLTLSSGGVVLPP